MVEWWLVEITWSTLKKQFNIIIVGNVGHFKMVAILKILKVECIPFLVMLYSCVKFDRDRSIQFRVIMQYSNSKKRWPFWNGGHFENFKSWMHPFEWCSIHVWNFRPISQSMTKKMRKTDFLRYSKSKKEHNSLRNWRNPTKRELDLRLITTKPYTKFQLNTSKHEKKKCGQLFAENEKKKNSY